MTWGIVAIAAVLRWHAIDAEGLWLDEASSYYFVAQQYDTAVELVTTIPIVDPHPPLYYLLLQWWTALFGTTEVGLRSLSMVVGVGTVLGTYLLAVKLFDSRSVGWIASGLVAVSSFHIHYAQEARMYTLLTLLSIGSMYWYVDIVAARDPSPASVSRYIVATVLLGYTHTFALFVIIAQNLFGLVLAWRSVADRTGRYGPRGRALFASATWQRWIAIQAAVGLALLPWLVVLTGHVFGLSFVGNPPTDWIPVEPPWYLFVTFTSYLVGIRHAPLPGEAVFTVMALGLTAIALKRSAGDFSVDDAATVGSQARSQLLAVWIAVGTAVPFVVSSLTDPIYRHRYTIGASIAFFIMIARGINELDTEYSRWLATGLAVLIVLATVVPVTGIYHRRQRPDWRGGVDELESKAGGDALVLTSPEMVTRPIEYYADESETTVVGVPETATWNGTLSTTVGNRSTVWIAVSGWHIDRSAVSELVAALETGGYQFPSEIVAVFEGRSNSSRIVRRRGVVAVELRRSDRVDGHSEMTRSRSGPGDGRSDGDEGGPTGDRRPTQTVAR